MEIQSSSSWMHSFSTLYVLRTHTTKAHPEILLFGWFLASQEKNQDKNQNNDNCIIQNNKEQTERLQKTMLAPYLGRGSPNRRSWPVLLLGVGSGRNLDQHRRLYKFDLWFNITQKKNNQESYGWYNRNSSRRVHQ